MTKLAIKGGSPVRTEGWPRWPVFSEEEEERILEAVRSGHWAYDGPMEAEFAQKFAAFQRAKYAHCVANGTIAIQLALEALDVGVGDEVIVPGLTFQATAAAALDINAVPVLVDVDPDTYCLNPAAAEEAITPRTRAIIPVHLYGCMADMDAICSLAEKHDLAVVEDCAHSHGSQWNGKGAGTLGDVGTFSFQGSKSLNAGEGGGIVTDDPELWERLYSLKNCGRRRPGADPTTWTPVQSGNYRLPELQAAILLCQLERLPEQMATKEANARYLDERLAQIEGLKPMKRHPQVTRQGYYSYFFRHDPAAFDDVPVQVFRQALEAELGLSIGGPYEPLNNCPLYRPHTKRRYRISETHWAAVDPTRFELPVCERAYSQEAVGFLHHFLLADREAMEDIVAAVHKLRDNLGELRTVEVP